MPKTPSVTAAEARANAAAIRDFWRAGRESLARLKKLSRQDPNRLAYGSKEDTLNAEARRVGTNIDQASKARRVASEYTLAEIKDLCDMVIAFRSRFGPTNLMFLLRIKSRARRDALMRRAVRESWTVTQLERSIQALRGGRRPFVGRQPAVPTDRAEKLIALDALASKWLRWVEVAMPDLPDELQPVLTKTAKAVREVQRTLAELQEVVDTLQK